MVLLYQKGGIYLDTDMQVKKGFGAMMSHTGLRAMLYGNRDEGATEYFYYDFIIAAKGLDLFKEAINFHRIDARYLDAQQDENVLFTPTTSRQGLRAYVLATTGSLLLYGFFHHESTPRWKACKYNDTLMASNYVVRETDNSWLKDDVSLLSEQEFLSSNVLIDTLHQQRVFVTQLQNKEVLQILPSVLKEAVGPRPKKMPPSAKDVIKNINDNECLVKYLHEKSTSVKPFNTHWLPSDLHKLREIKPFNVSIEKISLNIEEPKSNGVFMEFITHPVLRAILAVTLVAGVSCIVLATSAFLGLLALTPALAEGLAFGGTLSASTSVGLLTLGLFKSPHASNVAQSTETTDAHYDSVHYAGYSAL